MVYLLTDREIKLTLEILEKIFDNLEKNDPHIETICNVCQKLYYELSTRESKESTFLLFREPDKKGN